MDTINRSVAIIKPKQPFADWANQLPDAEFETNLKELQEDSTAILIPSYDTDKAAKAYITQISKDIFEEALLGWDTNEACWPADRSPKKFWEWFEVELHSVVVDSAYDDEPIERESY